MANADEATLRKGDRVDNYIIEARLGSGGFAEVAAVLGWIGWTMHAAKSKPAVERSESRRK